MNSVPLAKAKAQLSDLVRKAEGGEPTEITVHGRPVAQLSAVQTRKQPIDVEALQRLRDSMTGPEVDTETFWREFRGSNRY